MDLREQRAWQRAEKAKRCKKEKEERADLKEDGAFFP
jgi:hypothetical protein